MDWKIIINKKGVNSSQIMSGYGCGQVGQRQVCQEEQETPSFTAVSMVMSRGR